MKPTSATLIDFGASEGNMWITFSGVSTVSKAGRRTEGRGEKSVDMQGEEGIKNTITCFLLFLIRRGRKGKY